MKKENKVENLEQEDQSIVELDDAILSDIVGGTTISVFGVVNAGQNSVNAGTGADSIPVSSGIGQSSLTAGEGTDILTIFKDL